MSKCHTYAEAITDLKEWIAYEVETQSIVLKNLKGRSTRAFINGRLVELHAIDRACDTLLALNRLDES